MKIKEILTEEVKSISSQLTVKEALKVLLEKKISGLPVVDESGKLVGMFTEKEILTAILPGYLGKVGRFIYEENPKSIKNKFKELENLKVKDLMHKDIVTVDEDTAVCEVGHLMLTQKLRVIPILDKDKKLVGIVTREDIIKSYAQEAGWINP